MEYTTITASEGSVFRRIQSQIINGKTINIIMGKSIALGVDYSTGVARPDLPEYYEEIEVNIWASNTCDKRIVAPITLVNSYPQLLFDLTVVRKLQLEKEGDNLHIYCNYIEPEHQQLIDSSGGLIYVETKV